MGMNDIIKRSIRAQLMTTIVLVIFLLMFAELFTFALLNISSNIAVQSLTVSSSSSNYGNMLKLSAASFAKESASKALLTLINYEYRPELRRGNLIANFSFYVSNMMMSGVLPNDTSGYPQNAMGDLTLAKYNKSITTLLSIAANIISINETRPVIFQTDPYSLRVTYTENLAINASGNIYNYNIPVNVSIPLVNTPDLFYAQQGILRPIRFASPSNVTTVIGNAYATSGNAIGYAYGVVYSVPSSATSAATCPSPTPQLSKSLIIATYNAINLGSCTNNYGGLITYIPPNPAPTVPYLVYNSVSNTLQSLPTGMSVLLYGPGNDTLNMESLRNAIMNGYYFPSPFTPSYIDRASANFLKQSQNGMFTFSNYNTQAATFNGLNSYISVGNLGVSGDWTATFWATVNTMAPAIQYPVGFGAGAGIFMASASASEDCGLYDGTSSLYGNAISPNVWYYIAVIKSGTTYTLYINGNPINSNTMSSIPISNLNIGRNSIAPGYLSGSIANVQLYSSTLTPGQVLQMYQEGISGLPVTSNALVGWWPLNGNANDYSGNGYNGIATNTAYGLLQNYTRDSILSVPISTSLSPLPGVLSCNGNAQCASNSLPHLYLGHMPLEVQNGFLKVGNFNGQDSNVLVSPSGLLSGNQITMAVWVKIGKAAGTGLYFGTPISQGDTSIFEDTNRLCPAFTVSTDTWSQTMAYHCFGPGGWGSWNQYVGTYNGAALNLYVNGTSVMTNSMTGSIISNPVAIGSRTGSSVCAPGSVNCNFNGLLANVQIYSTALSANAVRALYQAGVAGLPFYNNLVGWWPLNGNANDYSNNGNNGLAFNVIYPYFSGVNPNSGLSSVVTTANEWQALGLAST